MKQEIRLYVNSEKQFADFNWNVFVKTINNARVKEGGINSLIEHAISVATQNKLQGGRKLKYYHFEGLPRNLKTGMTFRK